MLAPPEESSEKPYFATAAQIAAIEADCLVIDPATDKALYSLTQIAERNECSPATVRRHVPEGWIGKGRGGRRPKGSGSL